MSETVITNEPRPGERLLTLGQEMNETLDHLVKLKNEIEQFESARSALLGSADSLGALVGATQRTLPILGFRR